jgi:hypothetical protein
MLCLLTYGITSLCPCRCHPNIVQTYETRCAQLSDEFISMILSSAEAAANGQAAAGGQQLSQGQGSGSAPGGSYASQVGEQMCERLLCGARVVNAHPMQW